MKNLWLVLFFSAGITLAQTFHVEKVLGTVKVQIGTNENWSNVAENQTLGPNSIIETGKNSQVTLIENNSKFTLKSSSVLQLSDIKKMSVNDLILALAMEDMLNAPKKKDEANSKNTAVYGAQINGIKDPIVETDNFGIKKLNGAVQLAESGYKQSAVVDAKDTYRKYPETKDIASFRIYFANILFDFGLNDDAYDEFKSIQSLKLSGDQKEIVKNKLAILASKLTQK